jgi:HEAT repeat protein
LLELAGSPDASLRLAALEALQALGDETTVPALIPLLLAAKTSPELAVAERAVWLCAERDDDVQRRADPLLQAYERAPVAERAVLLPVLGRIGGARALEVVHAAGKDRNENLRAASVRALANWPDATAANELLELARGGEQPSYRVWALRGYIRIVTLPGVRSADETLALLEPALKLANRPDELQLILGRLSAVPCPRSLQIAMEYVDHPTLGPEAIGAAAKLAESLLPDSPELARDAITKILKVTSDPILRARLERAVNKRD